MTNKYTNIYYCLDFYKLLQYLPGVGVAMFIAGVPMGVFPGVSRGVEDPI